MDNNKLILRNQKFRDDIVALVNSYNDIPAFMRKITVQEIYQQLEIVEAQELANAQKEEQEKIDETINETAKEEENTQN